MTLPANLREFDQIVTHYISLREKSSGKRLSRTEGEADIRRLVPSVAAREKELREATELRESEEAAKIDAVDAWVRMGLSPEAAKIAARVESNEFTPKAVADYDANDWQALLDRRRR